MIEILQHELRRGEILLNNKSRPRKGSTTFVRETIQELEAQTVNHLNLLQFTKDLMTGLFKFVCP